MNKAPPGARILIVNPASTHRHLCSRSEGSALRTALASTQMLFTSIQIKGNFCFRYFFPQTCLASSPMWRISSCFAKIRPPLQSDKAADKTLNCWIKRVHSICTRASAVGEERVRPGAAHESDVINIDWWRRGRLQRGHSTSRRQHYIKTLNGAFKNQNSARETVE